MSGMTQGALLVTVGAVMVGRMFRWSLTGVAMAAAVGWVPWLLVAIPRAGSAAAALAAVVAFKRWGWRHVLGTAAVGLVFSAVLLGRISSGGYDFGGALIEAVYSTSWLVVLTAVSLWAFQLSRRGVDYLFGYGWVQEQRRIQQTAEHKHAMGLGRKGLGWAKGKARKAVTRRPGPEPKTVQGRPPKQLGGRGRDSRGRDSRGRFTPGGRAAAHHAPAQPTDGYGIAPPLFKPAPWWRWR